MYISIIKIKNNRITKFVEFKTLENAQNHANEYAGFVFNNSNNTPIRDLWVEGQTVTVIPVVEPKKTIYSPSDFFDLFTKAEWKAIKAASKFNDDIEYWMDKLRVVQSVDTTNPKTIAGMNQMVVAGLLTQTRVDEILS